MEAAEKLGMSLKDARVVVQGFGNVGYHAAYLVKNSTSPTGSENHLASFRFQNTFLLNV